MIKSYHYYKTFKQLLECDKANHKCAHFRHKVLEIHHTSEDKLDKLIKLGHQFEVSGYYAFFNG